MSSLTETKKRAERLVAKLHRESLIITDSKANAFLTDFTKGVEEALKIAKLKHQK